MTYGHHQAERGQGRNAERTVPLAKRPLSGGDSACYARAPAVM